MNLKKRLLIFFLLLYVFVPCIVFAYSNRIILGGENIGIKVNTKNVMIVGFYKVDGKYIGEDNISVTVLRNNKEMSTILPLIKDNNQVYKTGLYVKDQINGIGTLTYIDPNTKIYGALGHEIADKNTYKKVEIKDGYIYFGAGGALGFDTLAAQTVLELRKQYAQIRLILVLPCLSQTIYWREQDISEYERIKRCADKVVYTSQEYTRDCMYKRNRHLVDNSGLCICYFNEETGGTAYTVNYAKAQGLRIISLG